MRLQHQVISLRSGFVRLQMIEEAILVIEGNVYTL